MVCRCSLWLVGMAAGTLILGCGGTGPDTASLSNSDTQAAAIPAGFSVTAENPSKLRVLTFALPHSPFTCTAFYASTITHVQWVSDKPPSAETQPIALAARRDGRDDIYLAAPDGSWLRRLTGGGFQALHPTWNPPGTGLACARQPSPSNIWRMNAAGGERVRLTSSAQHDGGAAWSPDGLTIAFRRGEVGSADLAEVSASGGGFRWLARTSAFDRGPEWSPDGKTLVFASNRTGNWEIHTIDRSTLAVRNLTHNSAADLAPAWSTDGRRIVFGSNRTGNYELHSMNADGTRVRRLTQDPGDDAHPDWSPDGRKICYRWTDGSRAELRVINANGSGVRTLVGSPYEVQCTAWIVRGSQRVLVGAAGADAGYDPPLGPKRKAVLVIHDDHSIRSVVGIHSAGGAPVFLAMRPGGAIRATCQNAVSVVESWWMGEPAQWRLRRGQNSGHCRIVYDPRTGRVGRVAVVQ